MQQALTLYRTSIGKKAVMAITGIALFGFVLAHLLGNLQIYLGPKALNDYAASLRHIPALLWTARAGLLLAVVAHIATSFQVAMRNSDARPVEYRRREDAATNYAAQTMIWSGPILLLYIVYHLAHLTFGVAADYTPHNVYNNVILGFQVWWIAGIYVVGNVALGLHLFHGLWSMTQSLGLAHERYDNLRRYAAIAFAAMITFGNLSIPFSVMFGLLEPTDQVFCYSELEEEPGECGDHAD